MNLKVFFSEFNKKLFLKLKFSNKNKTSTLGSKLYIITTKYRVFLLLQTLKTRQIGFFTPFMGTLPYLRIWSWTEYRDLSEYKQLESFEVVVGKGEIYLKERVRIYMDIAPLCGLLDQMIMKYIGQFRDVWSNMISGEDGNLFKNIPPNPHSFLDNSPWSRKNYIKEVGRAKILCLFHFIWI